MTRQPDLDALAKQLKRPKGTLYALSANNDPFVWPPARIRNAEWFAEMWELYGRLGLHPHGLHYVLVSQPHGTIILPSTGLPYENTTLCDQYLANAARDARYLGLIPADDIADRRNAEAEIHHCNESKAAEGGIGGDNCDLEFQLDEPPAIDFPPVPQLMVLPPRISQPYQVEIWIEKSTMAAVIDPIARQYGVNVVPGIGQTSETRCRELVERASVAGKPVRILYVSDFDPSGDNMPVAAARKIEFWIRSKYPDLNVQLRPVALTKEQCIEFNLPRTPIKDTDLRKDKWEERHGEGATELDALEALYPGELGRILVAEIERYYDDTLQERIDDTESGVDAELEEINAEVRAEHEAKISALRDKHARLVEQFREEIVAIERKYQEEFQALSEEIKPRWECYRGFS
jgi:hypothetical protein